MNANSELVERIVQSVLAHLQSAAPAPRAEPTPAPPRTQTALTLSAAVITGELLAEQAKAAKSLIVGKRAVITPSAHDYLRKHNIAWSRADGAAQAASSAPRWRVYVSTATASIDTAIEHANRQGVAITREWSGTSAEAVKHMIASLTRAEIAGAVILTAEPARAACGANRHHAIRAAELNNTAQLASLRKQLGPNVYCIDPRGRSPFELRNLLQHAAANAPQLPAGGDV